MGKPAHSAEDFWDFPLHELFEFLPETEAGLTTDEARRRLRLYGPNSMVNASPFRPNRLGLRINANWRSDCS
jgi:hypothetical protein